MEMLPKVNRSVSWILVLAVLVITLTPSFYVRGYMLELLLYALVYVALVGAWNIISGYTGYLFLGTSAFFGVGAYFYALTEGMLPYAAAVLTAGALCFVMAFLIGIPLLRIRGAYFAIASYALCLLFGNLILYYEQVITATTGRWLSIQKAPLVYAVIWAITVLTLIASYIIKNSRFGYGLLSIKGDEDVAEALGINTVLYKCLAFGISAFFMGLVGAALIVHGGYVDTTIAFNPVFSFNTLIMGLVGGLGSIRGGLVSAIFISLLYELFGTRGDPYLFLIGLGILIFVIMFYAPKGVEGLLEKIKLLRK